MSFPTCFLCGDPNLAISTRPKRVSLPEFGGDDFVIACGDLERAALKGWISEQACEDLVKRLQPHCLCLDPNFMVFHQQYFGPTPAPFSIEAPTTIQTVYLGPELSNNSATTGIMAITAAVTLFCAVMVVMAKLIVSKRRREAGIIVQDGQDVTADELGQVKKMEMRSKVLKLLFPERPTTPAVVDCTKIGDSDEFANLAYDKEANVYEWTTIANYDVVAQSLPYQEDEERDANSTPCCSICLDKLEGKTIITLTCAHTFHHACVMEWAKKCKDDCAMCRTRMWNEELYKRLEQEVLLDEVGMKKVDDSTNTGATTH
jgi:hypothetical protein